MNKRRMRQWFWMGLVVVAVVAPLSLAASYTWYGTNTGGDGNDWNNYLNWYSGGLTVPPSSADTAYFADMYTADNNSHVVVPTGGAAIMNLMFGPTYQHYWLSGGPLTVGASAGYSIAHYGTTDVKIDCDIVKAVMDPALFGLAVGSFAPAVNPRLTLNGSVSDVLYTTGSPMIIVLGGNNTGLNSIYNYVAGTDVVANSANALGSYYWASKNSILSIQADTVLGNMGNIDLAVAGDVAHVRNRGTGGGHTLTISGGVPSTVSGCKFVIGANPDGGSDNLTIVIPAKFPSTNWQTRAGTSLVFNGSFDDYFMDILGEISGGGRMVLDLGNSAGTNWTQMLVVVPQTYTGGTFLNKGTLTLYIGDNCLPVNGDVYLGPATLFQMYDHSQAVGKLTGGDGGGWAYLMSLSSGTSTLTINGGLAPGGEPGTFGCIADGDGTKKTIVFGASSNSQFDLLQSGGMATTQDYGCFPMDDVTLGGTLTVNLRPGVKFGTYLLIYGNNISGDFSNVVVNNLPARWTWERDYSYSINQVLIKLDSHGDTNYDGVVDATDLATVLTAMDRVWSDTDWNPDADLDGDGEVTSSDLAIVLANFQ